MITNFTITGLHGYKDVDIKFDSPYLVLLSENGRGKTTILNLLYACLFGDAKKLEGINFIEATITFDGQHRVCFAKSDLEKIKSTEGGKGKAYSFFKRKHNAAEFDFIVANARTKMPVRNQVQIFASKFGSSLNLAALRDLIEEVGVDLNDYAIRPFFEAVRNHFPLQPLYLPTYRRIEEDLGRLGFDDLELPSSAINFGVADVQQKLNEIQKNVLLSSNEWFSKINGEILGKLVNGFKLDEADTERVASLEKIDVVLERIGKNVGNLDKQEIKRIFSNRELFHDAKYQPLVYFLSNMVTVYEQQKINDIAVKEFAQKCNEYLVDKDITYNESSLSVSIANKITGDEVLLDSFSSGEKQIVSLFSKLYLGRANDAEQESLAIFFDEPELSLSVEWQESLLPDIIGSERCQFLFAVTHSPFILKHIKPHARDLMRFVTTNKR